MAQLTQIWRKFGKSVARWAYSELYDHRATRYIKSLSVLLKPQKSVARWTTLKIRAYELKFNE